VSAVPAVVVVTLIIDGKMVALTTERNYKEIRFKTLKNGYIITLCNSVMKYYIEAVTLYIHTHTHTHTHTYTHTHTHTQTHTHEIFIYSSNCFSSLAIIIETQ